jgi:hypothetical protein
VDVVAKSWRRYAERSASSAADRGICAPLSGQETTMAQLDSLKSSRRLRGGLFVAQSARRQRKAVRRSILSCGANVTAEYSRRSRVVRNSRRLTASIDGKTQSQAAPINHQMHTGGGPRPCGCTSSVAADLVRPPQCLYNYRSPLARPARRRRTPVDRDQGRHRVSPTARPVLTGTARRRNRDFSALSRSVDLHVSSCHI